MQRSVVVTVLLVCCLLALAVAVPTSRTAPPPPATQFIRTAPRGDSHFYDEQGRVRIFHGSNRVYKFPPWYFEDLRQSDAEFELMQQMGFNVMRLGYMWTGVNPAPGVFNQTYVDIIKAQVLKMAARGVYTLLDMHEDVLSSKFCLYDGAPLWVVNKSMPAHAFPWPLHGNCSSRGWMTNTLTEAAATAYQDIYDNKHGMLDDLCGFWAYSAAQFKDMPAVLGYEIMNEPFAGNIYADPLLLVPGVAGGKNLQRMNDAVANAIRAHDDRHIVFYEPVTWGMLFNGKIVGSGFTHVPGGDAYQNRSAFSFHYYCASFVPSFETEPTMRKIVCDDVIEPLVFESVKRDLAKLGGAAIMTEGMSCDTSSDAFEQECQAVMAGLDKGLFSWTDYQVAQSEQWNPDLRQQTAWARTYARAVAGVPLSMTFDPVSKDFELCFTINTAIAAPTEIFASSIYSYQTGLDVNTTQNLVASVNGDMVLVQPSAAAVDGAKGCVSIHRKV